MANLLELSMMTDIQLWHACRRFATTTVNLRVERCPGTLQEGTKLL